MSKQQASVDVLEGNKIIAEFMKSCSLGDGVSMGLVRVAKYHSSWDWLKPVIDEIFTYALAHPEQVKVIRDISIVVEIGACWQKVVEFITWYNQNKQS